MGDPGGKMMLAVVCFYLEHNELCAYSNPYCCLRWALVHFDTPSNAQAATKLMHGTVLDDRHINVRLDRK